MQESSPVDSLPLSTRAVGARHLALGIGIILMFALGCRDQLSSITGPLRHTPPAPLLSVICPDGFTCAELDSLEWAWIQQALDEIDEMSNYDLNCSFIREEIEGRYAAGRLSSTTALASGGTGYAKKNSDNQWAITIDSDVLWDSDPSELIWTLIHEPRHSVKGHTHSGEYGQFSDEFSYIGNSCSSYMDPS